MQILDGKKVGEISVLIGAGRVKKEDDIDETVGIVLNKKIGDTVAVGETLAYIHANDEEKAKKAVEDLKSVYVISDREVEKPKNILSVIE